MASSILRETKSLTINQVEVTDKDLLVSISDRRTISIPLDWYPRLLNGSDLERNDFYLIAGGRGIHWEELDEDISLQNIIDGKHSQESSTSLQQWLQGRKK